MQIENLRSKEMVVDVVIDEAQNIKEIERVSLRLKTELLLLNEFLNNKSLYIKMYHDNTLRSFLSDNKGYSNDKVEFLMNLVSLPLNNENFLSRKRIKK